MAAPDNTKFQVNYKLADGTLVNLYATDIRDLETGLTDLSMVAALITSTADQFHGSRPAAPVYNNQFAPAPAASIAPAAPSAAPTAGHMCRHGAMNWKEGVGAKGPWKGWMCSAPKGTPQHEKCATIWAR
jgi:hypothetical protein